MKPSRLPIRSLIFVFAALVLSLTLVHYWKGRPTAPSGRTEKPAKVTAIPEKPTRKSIAVTSSPSPATNTEPKEEDLWTRQKWLGDYEGMIERRMIRALVPPSRMFFFIDRGKKQGLSYESLMAFENFINQKLKTRHLRIKVVVIPTARNRLLPDLVAGYGDIAVGNLTVTAARNREVDFSAPFLRGVDEIVVTGDIRFPLRSIFDLSGREVHVRRSSSYYDSLMRLNDTLISMRKAPVNIQVADEYLEDDDLLEMVNAGLIPITVVDSHKARFWARIFPGIVLHPKIRLRTDGDIAWALRKGCPKLKKVINEFVRKNKKGTLHGNILYRKYLENTGYLRNNVSTEERKRYEQTVRFFKKYGQEYGFPYLLLTALAYQESGLDQKKRSQAGAIGIMQVLPSTAADRNINIPDIHRLENNIHAGTKYLSFLKKRYFSDGSLDELNSDLFTIAAYNAGPARISRLRREAAERGLDPNVWFNNVEVVAAARIGRETVRYVDNIYKYYVAYKRLFPQQQRKRLGKTILRDHLSGSGPEEGQ